MYFYVFDLNQLVVVATTEQTALMPEQDCSSSRSTGSSVSTRGTLARTAIFHKPKEGTLSGPGAAEFSCEASVLLKVTSSSKTTAEVLPNINSFRLEEFKIRICVRF